MTDSNSSYLSKAWLVFDTCTRPEYYLDVHNLLALPRDYILRYEYREKYFANDVVTAIRSGNSLPTTVLLVYAQYSAYTRGGQLPPADTLHADSMMWLPTRVARMACAPLEDSEKFYLDLAVDGYPLVTAAELVFKDLFARQLTPFWKWVVFIDRQVVEEAKRTEDDSSRWQALVERLGVAPSQFAGDVFWRLVSVRPRGSDLPFLPQQVNEFRDGRIRQARSHYDLADATTYSIEIASIRSPAGRGGGDPVPFTIQAASGDDKILRLVTTSIATRQYTATHLEIETQALAFPEPRLVNLALMTSPRDGNWPQGPELRLHLRIIKPVRVILMALAALAIGSAVGVKEIREFLVGDGSVFDVALLLFSVILAALGATLWAGKLSTR